ncbi:MAG: ABC transporter ATP-binding protein [Henriciella sp.]|nr:ABC transporter ATP-binding protein [Henriciella sp.]
MPSYRSNRQPQKVTNALEQRDISLEANGVSVTFPIKSSPAGHLGENSNGRMVTNEKGELIAFRALEDVSFNLRQGDRLAIVGRNGSGKTTLLQVLAGILSPDQGRVTTWGRCTSLININLGIQPEATGHRNITLRGLAAGYSRQAIEEKREAIAKFSELGEFLKMPMEAYSAGMRMRLTFAIATAFDPELLVLDEWLSAGDSAFKRKATQRMQEFVRKAGILILASHNRELLLRNCNLCIWLDAGRVRKFGPAEETVQAYETYMRDMTQRMEQPDQVAKVVGAG